MIFYLILTTCQSNWAVFSSIRDLAPPFRWIGIKPGPLRITKRIYEHVCNRLWISNYVNQSHFNQTIKCQDL